MLYRKFHNSKQKGIQKLQGPKHLNAECVCVSVCVGFSSKLNTADSRHPSTGNSYRTEIGSPERQ